MTTTAEKGEDGNIEKESNKRNLCQSLRKDKEYRGKFLNTLILWWSFALLGWQVGQTGPSLLDIRFILNTTLSRVSVVLTAAANGYMVAGLATGLILGRVHTKLVLVFSCVVAAATTAAIPWCTKYEVMLVVNGLRGAVNGIQDTAGNKYLLRMWGSDSNSYMQAMHFAFAFGGIISPLVTSPFLLTEDDATSNKTNCSETGLKFDVSTISSDLSNDKKQVSRLYIAFITTTVFYTVAAILFMISYLSTREEDYVSQSLTSEENKKSSFIPLGLKIILIINLLLLMWMYCSVEGAFTNFLATFVVKRLDWSKANSSYITSVFFATFCAGRFTAIFVVKFIRPSKVLIIYAVALTLSSTGLLFSSMYFTNPGVWICVSVAGFMCSVIFPSIFTWIEAEFFQVTGVITSFFILAASVSGITLPILLGFLMDNITPMYFCYIILTQCVLMILLYSSATCLSFKVKKYGKGKEQCINADYPQTFKVKRK